MRPHSELTAWSTGASCHDFAAAFESVVDAGLTVKLFASLTHKEGNRAAEHAFEIDELVPVNLAEFLPVAKFHSRALHA